MEVERVKGDISDYDTFSTITKRVWIMDGWIDTIQLKAWFHYQWLLLFSLLGLYIVVVKINEKRRLKSKGTSRGLDIISSPRHIQSAPSNTIVSKNNFQYRYRQQLIRDNHIKCRVRIRCQ